MEPALEHLRQATSLNPELTEAHYEQSRVASLLSRGALQVWEGGSGVKLYSHMAHQASVTSVALSPNNLWLASDSRDNTVKLWEADTGQELQVLRGHKGEVSAVAFSPDGELLAAGCLGQVVIVWKRATGAVVKRLRYENISYNSVAFSPRGEWLALGSRDLQLWLKAILTEEEYAAVKANERISYQVCHLSLEKIGPRQ